MLKDLTILVTGGAGFIGSNLVDLLMENGYTVFVVDDLSTGSLDNLQKWSGDDNFRFIQGDIRHPLDSILTPSKMGGAPPIGYIFHLAALVDVTSSFQDPHRDISVNYIGTLNVVDFAMRNDVKKVIFSSSAAIFGDTTTLPVTEEDPKDPLSPYGLNKLASEGLLRVYNDQYGLNFSSLRFFNVYGPRQDPKSPYSGVISIFMEKARSEQPLMIYGDGKQTRDFVFVKDVARALMGAAISDFNGEINIGTGKETSILELADLVSKVAGKELKRVHLPFRKGEILRSVTSTERSEELFGPLELTKLKDGLIETYHWISSVQNH